MKTKKGKLITSIELQQIFILLNSSTPALVKRGLRLLNAEFESERVLSPAGRRSTAERIQKLCSTTDLSIQHWLFIILSHLRMIDFVPFIVEKLSNPAMDSEIRACAISALFATLPQAQAHEIMKKLSVNIRGSGFELAALLFSKEPWTPDLSPGSVVKSIETDPLTSRWFCMFQGYRKAIPGIEKNVDYWHDLLASLNQHSDPTVAEYSLWSMVTSDNFAWNEARIRATDIGKQDPHVRKWFYRLLTKTRTSVVANLDFLKERVQRELSDSAREGLAIGLGQYYIDDNIAELLIEWYCREESDYVRLAIFRHFITYFNRNKQYAELVYQEELFGRPDSDAFSGLAHLTLTGDDRRDGRVAAPPSSLLNYIHPCKPDSEIQMETSSHGEKLATIGIVTALEKEFVAMEVMLEDAVVWHAEGAGAGRRYLVGSIPAEGGGVHKVALALQIDMGNNSAAIRASQLVQHIPSIKHIIMCGIAGGIPHPGDQERDVRLGDIVVSDKNGVVQYDLIKQSTGEQIEYRSPPRPPSAELIESFRFLRAGMLRNMQPWNSHIGRALHALSITRPADNLSAKGNILEYPKDPMRYEGKPRVFAGPIASANRLLKDAKYRDLIAEKFGALAVEMEGSGIADASWHAGMAGYLVVRGICDYCDPEKGDLWQAYASIAAAAFVRALLERTPRL